MAYIPIPKDLSAVKTKIVFNLTRRQLLCFGCGALVGVPLFFVLQPLLGTTPAALCMICIMLPFFLMALYEKNGQSLEIYVRNIIRVSFLRSKKRPYRTNNFYSLLARQHKLDKEVLRIVRQQKPSHEKTN